MNILTIILLAFTAVGPLSARAMPGIEADEAQKCVWQTCGGLPCLATPIVATRNCQLGGVTRTQFCCGHTN
ncbi:hypothetical protein EDB19DRAFT_1730026 [Suillus lakei]|nr:hypothetical protein EDB19DRAFT_1730026 [Suillus lakei]